MPVISQCGKLLHINQHTALLGIFFLLTEVKYSNYKIKSSVFFPEKRQCYVQCFLPFLNGGYLLETTSHSDIMQTVKKKIPFYTYFSS